MTVTGNVTRMKRTKLAVKIKLTGRREGRSAGTSALVDSQAYLRPHLCPNSGYSKTAIVEYPHEVLFVIH